MIDRICPLGARGEPMGFALGGQGITMSIECLSMEYCHPGI